MKSEKNWSNSSQCDVVLLNRPIKFRKADNKHLELAVLIYILCLFTRLCCRRSFVMLLEAISWWCIDVLCSNKVTKMLRLSFLLQKKSLWMTTQILKFEVLSFSHGTSQWLKSHISMKLFFLTFGFSKEMRSSGLFFFQFLTWTKIKNREICCPFRF